PSPHRAHTSSRRIPLHPAAEKLRGFFQSFARADARPVAQRSTRQLDGGERIAHVAGPYSTTARVLRISSRWPISPLSDSAAPQPMLMTLPGAALALSARRLAST